MGYHPINVADLELALSVLHSRMVSQTWLLDVSYVGDVGQKMLQLQDLGHSVRPEGKLLTKRASVVLQSW